MLKTFAKTNEGLILYKLHCNGTPLVGSLEEATMPQQQFLTFSAAEDVAYEKNIVSMLRFLCESHGAKFKK